MDSCGIDMDIVGRQKGLNKEDENGMKEVVCLFVRERRELKRKK